MPRRKSTTCWVAGATALWWALVRIPRLSRTMRAPPAATCPPPATGPTCTQPHPTHRYFAFSSQQLLLYKPNQILSKSSPKTYNTYAEKRFCTVKKRFASFPSPTGMSLPNSPWAGIMTSLLNYSCHGGVWLVASRLETGNSGTFFYGVLEGLYCTYNLVG